MVIILILLNDINPWKEPVKAFYKKFIHINEMLFLYCNIFTTGPFRRNIIKIVNLIMNWVYACNM